MGTKIEALEHAYKASNKSTDEASLMDGVLQMIGCRTCDEGMMQLADCLSDLRTVKGILKLCSEAVNEVEEETNERLRSAMVADEMPRFSRRGQTFYLSRKVFATAKAEMGGLKGEPLITWLEEHDRGDLAARTVNASSLRSAVTEFLESIEVQDDDSQEERARKTAERTKIEALVNITERPIVAVRKDP